MARIQNLQNIKILQKIFVNNTINCLSLEFIIFIVLYTQINASFHFQSYGYDNQISFIQATNLTLIQ